jgi:hypothetical protein
MADATWRTMRELDEAARTPKGAAFRAFRAIEPQLVEGQDFALLEGDAARPYRPRAYATSPRVIVLAPAVAARVLAALR